MSSFDRHSDTARWERNRKILLAFAAVYLIWGSTYLAIRYAVETIPPLLMMGVRSTIAGLILMAWSRMRGERGLRPQHLPAIAVVGASFFLVGHGSLAWAEQRVPSGIAALFVASLPLWMALIEVVTVKSFVLTTRSVLGLTIGFGAIVLLVLPSGESSVEGVDLLGAGAILLGSLSWASGSVYSRSASLPRSPFLAAGGELFVGGVLLLLAGVTAGEAMDLLNRDISLASLLWLAYLIAFGSVVAFTAYTWLLSQTTATRVSTYAFVNPVIAILLGWLLGGETLTVLTIFATALIVVAVYLVLTERAGGSIPPQTKTVQGRSPITRSDPASQHEEVRS